MHRLRFRKSFVVALAIVAAMQLLLPSAGLASEPTPDATATELSALSDRIFAQLVEPNSLGVDLVYTGYDPSSNQVEIGIANYSPAIAERIVDRFGADRVRILPSLPARSAVLTVPKSESPLRSSRTAPSGDAGTTAVGPYCDGIYCAPTRGGVILAQDTGDGEVSICTSTIVGTDRNGRNSTLTAGHCFDRDFPVIYGTFVPPVFVVDAELGWVTDRQSIGSSDHLVIPWSSPIGTTGMDYLTNCIYLAVNNDCWRVNFNAGSGDVPVGANVTQYGVTTRGRSGPVILPSTNVDVEIAPGVTIRYTDMVMTGACALPGDSGGPAFANDRLVGTISVASVVETPSGPACPVNPRTWISKATNAYWNLGFSSRLRP